MSKPRSTIKYLNADRKSLRKRNISNKQIADMELEMENIISNKIHGISFSPYLDGQDPSVLSVISDQQIADRLEIIRPYCHWVRTFSCSYGNEVVPRIAHEKSLKTLVGVWIGEDLEQNEIEINNAITIAKAGDVDILAVGNEVLLREEIEPELLISYIQRVKKEVPDLPVGYVDAYYTYANYPEIVENCDVILANCYPFWEHCDIDISISYMKEMYNFVEKVAQAKKIIISETGWPSKGERYGDAVPTYENALTYFIQTQEWAKSENIDVFYFSSFDEEWKVKQEGEYGAYWGIWDKDGLYKFKK